MLEHLQGRWEFVRAGENIRLHEGKHPYRKRSYRVAPPELNELLGVQDVGTNLIEERNSCPYLQPRGRQLRYIGWQLQGYAMKV